MPLLAASLACGIELLWPPLAPAGLGRAGGLSFGHLAGDQGLFVWFGLAEEIGMRGYLQPRLMSLGRTRALFLVGLVFATWHFP